MPQRRRVPGGAASRPAGFSMSKDFMCKGGSSAVVGAIVGALISFVVNVTLVEISMSHFFAMYVGILFVSVGLALIWRVTSQVHSDDLRSRRQQLLLFAGMVVVSGVLCFTLRHNWFVGMSPILKIPVYTLLGTSVSFALAFSLVDLINFVVGLSQSSMARAVVESQAQVHLILMFAVAMGGIFGFIFGLLDVEDALSYQVQPALQREQKYCYPLGALLGAMAGVGNEYLKQQERVFIKMQRTEFDEEI